MRLALPFEVDVRLMEIGFGEWEGRTAEELLATDPERLTRFGTTPCVTRRRAAKHSLRFATASLPPGKISSRTTPGGTC